MAENFSGSPIFWGGKSSPGIDCSGLVQIALAEAGSLRRATPIFNRRPWHVPISDVFHLRRGDLVFWKGHVGIMRDGERLLHANAHHMLVASEPLSEARARIAA